MTEVEPKNENKPETKPDTNEKIEFKPIVIPVDPNINITKKITGVDGDDYDEINSSALSPDEEHKIVLEIINPAKRADIKSLVKWKNIWKSLSFLFEMTGTILTSGGNLISLVAISYQSTDVVKIGNAIGVCGATIVGLHLIFYKRYKSNISKINKFIDDANNKKPSTSTTIV